MDATTFLNRVLPGVPGAYYSVHYLDHTKEQGRNFWGRAFTSLPEIASWAAWGSGKGLCSYFACSAQMRAEVQTTADGATRFKPVRSAANAKAMKSLWMDIDIGKPGAYSDLKEAVTELNAFCSGAAIPKPTILVASGSGLHVYWTMTEIVSPTDWTVLANALKNAASTYGLRQDPTRTADPASVLRVPGTMNWKDKDNARPVSVLGSLPHDYTPQVLRDALAPYTVAMRQPQQLPPGFGDLTSGVQQEARPVDLAKVLPECEVLRTAAETGGEGFQEPLWYQTLRAASYAENGLDWAHTFSKGHDEYDAVGTEKKFQQALQAKDANNLGWPSCAQFAQHKPEMCAKCPHASEGKSPLNFRQGEVNDLPAPYTRHPATGIIFVPMLRKGKGDEEDTTTTVPVLDYPLHSAEIGVEEGVYYLRFHARVPGTHREVVAAIPLEKLADNRSTLSALSRAQIVVSGAYHDRIREFLVAWVKKLQKTTEITTHPAFGWAREDGEIIGFSYAGLCHTKDGEEPVSETNQQLKRNYAPVGKYEAWREAARVQTTQGRAQIDALMASAFAGPLIEFTDEMGLVMSFMSGSGTGKTSAMRTAQAVWGDPHAELQSLQDTPANVGHKLGKLRALPLYWDEVRGEENSLRFAQMVFQVTYGKEKSRMTSNMERRETGTWNTMLIAATNQSILERVADASPDGAAGIYRVFEIDMPPIPANSASAVDFGSVIGKVRTNFGHAGLIYSKYLGENHAEVAARVKEVASKLYAGCKARYEERFWIYTMATLIVGAELSKKLDLTDIDVPGLAKFLTQTALPAMRETMQDGGVASMEQARDIGSIIADFVREQQPERFICTDHIGRGKQPVTILSNEKMLRRPDVHIVQSLHELRISRSALNAYLKKHSIYRRGFASDLTAKCGARMSTLCLGVGTPFSTATPEGCWVIDLKHPSMSALQLDVEG